MTILKMEGFDLIDAPGDLTARGFAFGEGTLDATASNWGTQVVDLGTGTATVLSFKLNSILAEEYVNISVWRYFSTLVTSSTGALIGVVAAHSSGGIITGNVNNMLGYSSAGVIKVMGGNGSVKETTGVVLIAGVWQHHEFRSRIHNTLGTLEYWLDGIKIVDRTGEDTSRSLADSWVVLTGGTSATNAYVDDLVIQQGTSIQPHLEPTRIHTLFPDGNGTNSAWTGTFADVDDGFGLSDGDSTFANSSTLNAKQDYTVEDLSESPTTIHAVALNSEMRKTDANTKAATPYLLSNAVEGTGTEHGASESYTFKIDLFDLDPDGSAAWDTASINALLIGHEITT